MSYLFDNAVLDVLANEVFGDPEIRCLCGNRIGQGHKARMRKYCSKKCHDSDYKKARTAANKKNRPHKCHVCKTPIEQPKAGGLVKYCSVACRSKVARQRKRSGKARPAVADICQCGSVIDRSRKGARRRYCSDACYDAANNARNRRRRQKESPTEHVECAVCHEVFRPNRNGSKYCSDTCREIQYNNRLERKRSYVREHECERCGKEMRKKGVRFCRPCAKARERASTARSDAIRRSIITQGENIIADDIFERDGWICQLCGNKTTRSVHHNHSKYATIDHIIPLSKGGEHRESNVQCSCRRCNVRKGNRIGGDQLRIGL